MLDERLLGMTFTNMTTARTGEIELFGVFYHYQIHGAAQVGDQLEVVRITPLSLIVQLADSRLTY